MTATGFAFFISPLLSQIDAPVASTAMYLLSDIWISSSFRCCSRC